MIKPVRHPKSQVRIEFKDLDSDNATVERILLAAASKFNLYDNSDESRVPQTIRSIGKREGTVFGLGARVVEKSILVDFNRRGGDSAEFDQVHNFILDKLQKAFHMELIEVWEDDPRYCETRQSQKQ